MDLDDSSAGQGHDAGTVQRASRRQRQERHAAKPDRESRDPALARFVIHASRPDDIIRPL